MRKYEISLKGNILISILAVVSLLSAGMMAISFYYMQSLQKHIYESSRTELVNSMKTLDQELQNISFWLSSQAVGNSNNANFAAQTKGNAAAERAKTQIGQNLQSALAAYPIADGMICTLSGTSVWVLDFQSGTSTYHERVAVRDYVIANAENLPAGGKWRVCEIGDETFLLCMAEFRGVCYTAWTSWNTLMNEIGADQAAEYKISFVTEDGEAAGQARGTLDIPQKAAEQLTEVSRHRYLITECYSAEGDFGLLRLDDRRQILGVFYVLPWIILGGVSLVTVIGLLVILHSLNYTVFAPVARMEKGIKQIEKGNLEVRIENRNSSPEIGHLVDSFNEMTAQIQNLRIRVYEDQLEHQRQELDYLQLQLEPHFYLNALNLINMMAQVGDTELIQQLTQNLSEYLRYVVSARKQTVSLQQELTHVGHYLKIMEIRLGADTFQYHCETEESLLIASLLPLTLQTLVENSLKYAFSLDRQTIVEVSAKQEGGDMVLRVWDNGPGYPEEYLKRFQAAQEDDGKAEKDGHKHIGLFNLRLRLRYLYAERASFVIFNRQEGGACTVIRIPLKG